ncbi:hypothetical protein LJR129_004931 [Acidovorax sp. LjRoot129]|uniref:hypothetical protein n=1 Tax=unclassified Acidovorax TaxID=2684926 RepID=UPI003ECCD227
MSKFNKAQHYARFMDGLLAVISGLMTIWYLITGDWVAVVFWGLGTVISFAAYKYQPAKWLLKHLTVR